MHRNTRIVIPNICCLKKKLLLGWLLPAFFFFSATLLSQNICSQEYSHTHYITKDGLPSSIVYDITQDKKGFIWFATENGLSRFDGSRFQNFSTKDGLPDNAVLRIFADKSGKIFFAPFTHLPHYYFEDSIHQLTVTDKYKPDLSGVISFGSWQNKTIIRAASFNYVIDQNGIVTLLNDEYKNIPYKGVISVMNDSAFVVFRNDSLFRQKDQAFNFIGLADPFRPLITCRKNGELVLAEKISEIPASPIGNLSHAIFYMTQNNSVLFFSGITGKFLYKITVEKPSAALIDNEDNLWITTIGNGVYRFPSLKFRQFTFGQQNEIFSIANFNSHIIAGTDFSKTYIIPNKSDNDYSLSDYSPYLAHSGNPISLSSQRNRITKLLQYENSLYIGADAFLLKQDHLGKIKWKNIFPVKDIDPLNKNLLVSTGRCVLLLDANNLSVKDTLFNQRATKGVFYNGDYYIGTLGGLVKIDAKNKTITSLQYLSPALKSRITDIKRGGR